MPSGKSNPDCYYLEMEKTDISNNEHEHTMHYGLLVYSDCVAALICRPALLCSSCISVFVWSSGIIDCMLLTIENMDPLMR